MKLTYTVSLLLAIVQWSACADYWITPSGGVDCRPPGSTDPLFVATTADSFDSYLQSIPANSIIHLCAGTFLTRGNNVNGPAGYGFTMKSGWKIYGAGPNTVTGTVVKLTDVTLINTASYNNIGQNIVFASPVSAGYSGMEVHDLVVDGNAINIYASKPSGAKINIAAVTLIGRNNKIINVLSLGSSGDMPTQSEVFILKVGNQDESVTGVAIDNCTVQNFYEPYNQGKCTAIQIGGGSQGGLYTVQGEATNNVVWLNSVSTSAEYAYNVAASAGVTFSGNQSSGAMRAFNNDADANSCINITNNVFHVPAQGIGAKIITSDHSYLQNNTFYVLGGATAIEMYGVIHWNSGFYPDPTNVTTWWVRNNSVITETGISGFAMGFNLNPTLNGQSGYPTNLRIENNAVGTYFYNAVPSAVGYG